MGKRLKEMSLKDFIWFMIVLVSVLFNFYLYNSREAYMLNCGATHTSIEELGEQYHRADSLEKRIDSLETVISSYYQYDEAIKQIH